MTKCSNPSCKGLVEDQDVAQGYKSCAKCRATANLQYRRLVERHRLTGCCVKSNCRAKAVQGELKCRKHKRQNRAKCVLWGRAHAEEYKLKDLLRKEAWIAQGRCPTCKPHRPLIDTSRRCLTCRKVNTDYGVNPRGTQTRNTPTEELVQQLPPGFKPVTWSVPSP